MIISRFLYQARRIWPPAIVSVSQIAALIIRSIPDGKGSDSLSLDARMHHRLCKFHNQTLRLLALPASINPLKSMSHNWQAQKVLIEMIGQFNPPLTLDQGSYRAVAQVLAASQKSERETKVANLRTRSWPPWRIDQHGIDAQRSPEEDLSRVVSAGIRTKEAGYTDNVDDLVMRILGGQDPDGTPTIQTRKLIKRRSQPDQNEILPESDPDLWAARIDATRDIQEAWGAFKNFELQGGHASPRMYLAMFEKLNYNEARFREKNPSDATPGDGKEVLMPSNDNMSISYRRGVSPPTIDELYDKMIISGIRPSGRLLTFLYHILEPRDHTGEPILNTLHRSIELLKASQTRFRPAWYALFQALARRSIVIDRDLAGDPRNDLLAWQMLFAALGDFQRLGLELDPQGFMIICHGLEKALCASFDVSADDRSAVFTKCPATVVTDEFVKISVTSNINSTHTPDLLHSIAGVHLHAYVRVLGLMEDYMGIISVLKWMQVHQDVLDQLANQSRSGQKQIRQVFIAMRAFLDNTIYEAEAQSIVESVQTWAGWPHETETQKYLELQLTPTAKGERQL
ncbi:hypothetical protein OIDMADRAFT_123460 [Oidiodendron maius Zn]|uniref:Uncharacterized protein n=1 Tax=Oidiodendron maius (strain Zn) TaxID=913774 RepID=A0A0C3GY52_OIDMZ|nr:hypothetical protein OIDMADRAFT_123460 [Oidiodendron maius Zn]